MTAMKSGDQLTSDARGSEAQSTARGKNSVYDFLYHDARRVASYLAQFQSYGSTQSVRATESVGRTSTRRTSASANIGVPGVAGGRTDLDIQNVDDEKDVAEHIYDPLWTNARTLLDFLAENDMVERDIQTARIGQFVLIRGTILLFDLAMLKGAWEKAPIQKLMKAGADPIPAGNRAERRANGVKSKSPSSQISDHIDLVLSLLSILPHSIQIKMITAGGGVWSTLDEASIVGRSGDLVLKHGAVIEGDWYMLGILDAQPYVADMRSEDGELFTEVFAKMAGTEVAQLAARLAPAARSVLGRPPLTWGVTPLLIFRDVNGEPADEAIEAPGA
ncbi:DUF6414 family protein [Ancylobacter defluvii]|nr:hypothetical protein [Ancylobacter defluvii]MBS7588308.1 hypothetical protein [Ancylobacter defluvii]